MNQNINDFIDKGTKVHYLKADGTSENGIVKSIRDENYVFVVFHCCEDWENYQNYTGQLTKLIDLHLNWKENEKTTTD